MLHVTSKVDSLTFINFPENYQTAEIYTHTMLFHSIKQYVIILSTTIRDKSSSHTINVLFKTGDFIKHLIHLLFHSF